MNPKSHATATQRTSLTPEPYLMHREDSRNLQAPVRVVPGHIEEADYDDEDTPMTRAEFAGLILLGIASWAVIGLAFWGAFKLAEVLR